MSLPDPSQVLAAFASIAAEAGAVALDGFRGAGAAARSKADGSPVTDTDIAVETLIVARLAAIWPAIPVLGEERVSDGHVPDLGRAFFCVDPIDGTRQFAGGEPEWVISLGWVVDGAPVAGLLSAPALELTARGARGVGARVERRGAVLSGPAAGTDEGPATGTHGGGGDTLRVLHGVHDRAADIADMLAPLDRPHRLTAMGSALKFALIAAGEADVFARTGRVHDWDIAAGVAIVEAAGGSTRDLDGRPLVCGDAAGRFRQPPFLCLRPGLDLTGWPPLTD